MKKKKFTAVILTAALLCFLMSGCSQEAGDEQTGTDTSSSTSSTSASSNAEYSDQVFAMDTYMTLTAYGENAQEAVEAGIAEIERLDALLSTGTETSEVAVINANGGGTMSEDTLYLVERSLEIYESTGGAYDITIYPVMVLWGFTNDEFAVPDDESLAAALELVDAGLLSVTENEDGTGTLTMAEGQEIDLGGIAKGYASGRVMEIFEEYGITSAMISLGGNVHVLGNKTDGSQWRVGIQDPDDSSAIIAGLLITGEAVITSGGYERYFEDEETGMTYHHIIDPETGYSAYNGLVSVTIISEDSTLADALSTSLFVMGTEEAINYCETYCSEYGFEALLVTDDGDIYITAALEDDIFSVDNGTNVYIIETEG